MPRTLKQTKTDNKEFEKEFKELVAYFNNPKNDYLGMGFGYASIARMLNIGQPKFKRYAKKLGVKVHNRNKKLTYLDDAIWVRSGMQTDDYLKMHSRYETPEEMASNLNVHTRTLMGRMTCLRKKHLL